MNEPFETIDFRFVPFFNNRPNPFEVDSNWYKSLPSFNTIEELETKESSAENEAFQTPAIVLDEFLKRKFDNMGIIEFMKTYSKLHFKATINEDSDGIALPVPPNIVCFFNVEKDPLVLQHKILNHQPTLITDHFGITHLNLLTSDIYRFTVIRTTFNLEEKRKLFFNCYPYKTDNYYFLLKSSAQFHITVLYEDLRTR